jgi:hypothetical protein
LTSLAERTLGASDRTGGLPERRPAQSERGLGLSGRLPENLRDLQEVALILVDGTEVRGTLHRATGTRTLDFLNRQAETFIALTDVMLHHGESAEHVSFIAINKTHIVRVLEADDLD